MWIRLEKAEVEEILEVLPAGSVAEKLRQPPHPETSLFAEAVNTSDDLEVDPDTVISRGEDGAFVMSWVWISNERAGLDTED